MAPGRLPSRPRGSWEAPGRFLEGLARPNSRVLVGEKRGPREAIGKLLEGLDHPDSRPLGGENEAPERLLEGRDRPDSRMLVGENEDSTTQAHAETGANDEGEAAKGPSVQLSPAFHPALRPDTIPPPDPPSKKRIDILMRLCTCCHFICHGMSRMSQYIYIYIYLMSHA